MTDAQISNEVLSKTFMTALLLTGSEERAEAAVVEGINAMERCRGAVDALLQGTIAASIARRFANAGIENRERGSFPLPVELRRVLRLPQDLRYSYVLRVLAGMSREFCARMLRTQARRIDELVSLASRTLALQEQS